MRIGKIASSAEYRMNEQFQNCQFLEPNFGFPNFENLEICEFSNLDNSKNFQFRKFQKFPVWHILQISYLENSKNLQFVIFQKFSISNNSKFSKFYNLENYKNKSKVKKLNNSYFVLWIFWPPPMVGGIYGKICYKKYRI